MDPLRVMTFNIRYGRALDGQNRWYRRRELVFDVLRKGAVHVAGLQEVSSVQMRELRDALPGYGIVADRSYGGRWSGTYAAILYDTAHLEPVQTGDFWLGPDPERRTRAWDAAVPRICTWAVFRSGGQHSAPPNPPEPARFAVFNSHFDQRGVEARLESARLVASRLDELAHLPRLVTADLNANEASEPLQVFAQAGFRDTYRVVCPDAVANTYHGFRGRGVRSLGKIDFILCDEPWTVHAADVLTAGVDGRFASDHFPVTAEVAL